MINSTTNTSISIDDSTLDLISHLQLQQVEKNLSNSNDISFDLTEELLSDVVNQPLKVIRDRIAGRDYLLCDYNRNEDSYRSPWTNTYTPPSNGNFPSDRLRQLEIETNQMFAAYCKMYFEGGVSSVYFWDLENGFAGVILIKKCYDGNSTSEGCCDSFHVVVVEEKQNGRSAHYKLISTVMLWLQTDKTTSGMMNLAEKVTQQFESDHEITYSDQHMINIGIFVEEMENKIHQTIISDYSGKIKDELNSLYTSDNSEDYKRSQQNQVPDWYWKLLTEPAQIQFCDQYREIQQLHKLADEINEEINQPQPQFINNCETATNDLIAKLMEEKQKLDEEKKKFQDEKKKFQDDKKKFNDEKKKFQDDKKKFNDEKKKELLVKV